MKSYGLDYVAGTGARKLDYDFEEEVKVKKVKKSTSSQPTTVISKKTKVKCIASVVFGFSMFMVITYRYSMISEANLKTIKLKSELEAVSSDLSLAIMNVEQGANLNEIEAYAKQKLGMQKPDKNQIVYVDSSLTETEETSKVATADSFLDKLKNFFGIN